MSKNVTEKVLAANRQNSLKSTGPQSPEGKETVSRNAVKHAMFASPGLLIGNEDERQRYEMLLSELQQEFQPQTLTERLEVEQLAINLIRKRKLLMYEASAAEIEMGTLMLQDKFNRAKGRPSLWSQEQNERLTEALAFLRSDTAVEKTIRYEGHIERLIERNLSRLREAKKGRLSDSQE
jgi:hypothetical protein